jgi:hypothetical protein
MLRFLGGSRAVAGAGFRAGLWPALVLVLLTALASLPACGGWRQQSEHAVPALTDPTATYVVVLETLRDERYSIVGQDAAARLVRVRSHVDEKNPTHVSVISLLVDNGAVHLSAAGYLVRSDGTTHHALNSELASLHRALQKKLYGAAQGPSGAASAPPPALAVAPSTLPVAWNETSPDGHGTFTCLPIKLAEAEQSQLSLKLSTGENADVSLSLAPGLCRSPTSCKLPGGCPALGIADTDRVSRLAARLSKHEIGPLATLLARGQGVVVIDLSKHGSIAQAIAEKH